LVFLGELLVVFILEHEVEGQLVQVEVVYRVPEDLGALESDLFQREELYLLVEDHLLYLLVQIAPTQEAYLLHP